MLAVPAGKEVQPPFYVFASFAIVCRVPDVIIGLHCPANGDNLLNRFRDERRPNGRHRSTKKSPQNEKPRSCSGVAKGPSCPAEQDQAFFKNKNF